MPLTLAGCGDCEGDGDGAGAGDGDGAGVGVGDGDGDGVGAGADGGGAGGPLCVTVYPSLAIAMWPTRCGPAFAATVIAIVAVALPLAGPATIQLLSLDADHAHPVSVVNVTESVPPVYGAAPDGWLSA